MDDESSSTPAAQSCPSPRCLQGHLGSRKRVRGAHDHHGDIVASAGVEGRGDQPLSRITGVPQKDAGDLPVPEHVRQAVGAEEDRRVWGQRCLVDVRQKGLAVEGAAQRLGDDVGAPPSDADVVVAGELGEAGSVQPIGPAVADVEDDCGRTEKEQADDGRAHPWPPFVAVHRLKQAEVGRFKELGDIGPARRAKDEVLERVQHDPAGHVPGIVTAHPVCDDGPALAGRQRAGPLGDSTAASPLTDQAPVFVDGSNPPHM